jgi:hypothetical protein
MSFLLETCAKRATPGALSRQLNTEQWYGVIYKWYPIQPRRTFYVALSRRRQERAPAVERGHSKVFNSADDAIADLQDGAVILSAGFGLSGVAGT